MSDQPTDAPGAGARADSRAQRSWDTPTAAAETAPPGESAPTDWRVAERPAKGWSEWLLAGALVSLGLAILAGAVITGLWRSAWAQASASLVLWIGMLLPTVVAFSRARPGGLLRFRPIDLLYGAVLGAGLRIVQGWLAAVLGEGKELPSYPLVDGALPTGWWLTDGFGAAVVSPVVEEFFFRAVVLVSLYLVLRGAVGKLVAAIVALLVSSGLFVVVHGLALSLPLGTVLSLALLASVCGSLVLLTGRIWGAVLVHIVFNASYVALALAGTFLA
ncbi:type II CAAX endopeptidase family protein [Microbacterium sp. NPDC019599]|uniref:CPBP family intramembrane glutamic endopeptidase n=1 Tax=Microbacterium sp. NPDC019599 TaxID=3154690 RepID=UPI0033E254F6